MGESGHVEAGAEYTKCCKGIVGDYEATIGSYEAVGFASGAPLSELKTEQNKVCKGCLSLLYRCLVVHGN